jgi:hypothetical protein
MGRSTIHVSMYITLVSINGKSTIHVYYTCFYQWEGRLSMHTTLVSINRKVNYLFILHLFLFLDRSTIYVYYTCFYQLEGRLSMYTTLVSINVKVDYPCILHLVLSMGRSFPLIETSVIYIDTWIVDLPIDRNKCNIHG